MNIESFRDYCLAKKGVTEDFPFDENTLVFKVMNKMFALSNINSEIFSINLKCDPELSLEYREKYDAIQPGYHMNKKHWNTVKVTGGELSEKFMKQLIDHSYDLIIAKMPKKLREELNNL